MMMVVLKAEAWWGGDNEPYWHLFTVDEDGASVHDPIGLDQFGADDAEEVRAALKEHYPDAEISIKDDEDDDLKKGEPAC